MKYKYIVIKDDASTIHKTLRDVGDIIGKDHTTISKLFKYKHFIEIDDYIIYKFNWVNRPPPTIVKFN